MSYPVCSSDCVLLPLPAACHVAQAAAATRVMSIKVMTLTYTKNDRHKVEMCIYEYIYMLYIPDVSSAARDRSVEIIINFEFGHRNYADTLHWPHTHTNVRTVYAYIGILTA